MRAESWSHDKWINKIILPVCWKPDIVIYLHSVESRGQVASASVDNGRERSEYLNAQSEDQCTRSGARNSPKTILVTWSEHRDLESEIWTKMEIVVQDQKCDTVISVSHLSSKTEYYNLNMVFQNTLNFR